MINTFFTRRRFLQSTTALAAGVFLPTGFAQDTKPDPLETLEAYLPKGPLKQSCTRFIINQFGIDKAIAICKHLGLVGMDLLDPSEWDVMLKNDLIVTMGRVPGNGGIPNGFNRLENHDLLVKLYAEHIALAAEKKVPNLICLSGNRAGLSDEEGIENCVIGLKQIMPAAEKHGVTICMELLNDKDHKDYQACSTPWGAEVCHRVGSERMKLLYDIYHMQRMEGELINNITKYKDVIGHYHTAGNPGRKDLDDEQEIYYPAVVRAILRTGFTGYFAHEFSPKDGMNSLRRAIETCDVQI
jgi:hydroxypyruvate isomerase